MPLDCHRKQYVNIYRMRTAVQARRRSAIQRAHRLEEDEMEEA